MECFCYFAQRARHDGPWQAGIGEENMARKLTDCQFLLEHWLSISQLPRKTSQEYISLERQRWRESSWAVFHVREEVGQETWWRQTVQICMNQKPQEFTCANGTLSFPKRPRPSLPAEGNLEPEDDVEIEEGDNKGSTTEDSWSMSGEFIHRHHEELRLKFYDPDNETFPIPLKNVNVMRQTQTKKKNVSEHTINDTCFEAKGVTLAEEWTATARFQILRTRLLEGYRCVNGRPTKIQKTTRPDSIWPEAWTPLFKEQKKTNELAEWAQDSAKLQAARRNKGTHEVVDRWQRWLQGDCWSSSDTGKTLLMLCHALRRKGQANLRQLKPLRNRQIQKRQEHTEQWSDNMWTTSPKKGDVGSFHCGLVHKPVFIEEAMQNT